MGDRLGTPGAVGFLALLVLPASLGARCVTRDEGDTGPEVEEEVHRGGKNFFLFSKCAHPPNQIRNPKTEHRVEIYLNISDYM